MKAILLILIVPIGVIWVLIAKLVRDKAKMLALAKKLADAEARVEDTEKMRNMARRAVFYYLDVLEELGQYDPQMPSAEKSLLMILAEVLTKLPVPDSNYIQYKQISKVFELSKIEALVQQVDNPKITELWQRGKYEDIFEIVRGLMMQKRQPDFWKDYKPIHSAGNHYAG